jgi:hypothetical protein
MVVWVSLQMMGLVGALRFTGCIILLKTKTLFLLMVDLQFIMIFKTLTFSYQSFEFEIR